MSYSYPEAQTTTVGSKLHAQCDLMPCATGRLKLKAEADRREGSQPMEELLVQVCNWRGAPT